MKRRSFLRQSSLTAMSVGVFGSIRWNGTHYVGDKPTTTDILGPFYRPGAPMRSDLTHPGSNGIPVDLSGIVYAEDGHKLAGALVELWHCDEHAYYDNTSDDYLFRGVVQADSEGFYELHTIMPVPYQADPESEASWRPAHYHMRVSIPGQQDLITQIYFKEDPYLETDSSSSAPEAMHRILDAKQDPDGKYRIRFDITLASEMMLSPEVFAKITGLYDMGEGNVVEFYRNDDLLFLKRNGQVMASLTYKGDNTFIGGMGRPKVRFELLEKGGSRVTIQNRKRTMEGIRYLKYSD